MAMEKVSHFMSMSVEHRYKYCKSLLQIKGLFIIPLPTRLITVVSVLMRKSVHTERYLY